MRSVTRSAIAAVALLAGCVDEGPGPAPRKVDPAYVRAHLLAAEPAGIARLDVTLDGAVVYLGNKLEPARAIPGQPVTITHYWRVLRPVGPRWNIFTLVRAPAGEALGSGAGGEVEVRGSRATGPKVPVADFMNLGASDMQFAYGPAKWRAGDVIEDVQTFTLRPDWRSPTATILVGLIESGGHDTLDRMPAAGPHTQDRAIVARTLEVDASRAPPPAGTVHVRRATGPITVDGSGAEAGWGGIAMSPEFATAEGSLDPPGKATAKLAWDDANLYVFASIVDPDIYSAFTKHDDTLWKADCLELFIDADGNRRGYVELQVSPNNVTFDSWFAGGRAPSGDVAWDSGMQTAVKLAGTGNVAGDRDTSWDVEIAIPWAAVKGRDEAMQIHTPPAIGDRWRLNLVRVDRRGGSDATTVASWNRITMSDFHALDRLLTVVFTDTSGSSTPTRRAPATPTEAAPVAAPANWLHLLLPPDALRSSTSR